jgi:hypothetical protein
MRKSRIDTARYLAEAHFRVEPNLKRVILLTSPNEDDPREPIKLLEIVEGTLAEDIMPVAFAPDPAHGVDFPSFVVEISPRAFRELGGEFIEFRGRRWKIGEDLAPVFAGI